MDTQFCTRLLPVHLRRGYSRLPLALVTLETHLPLHQHLLVLCPWVVAVADPRRAEARAGAGGLAAGMAAGVVLCVLVLAAAAQDLHARTRGSSMPC